MSFLLALAVAGADELNQTRLLTRTGSLTGVGQDILGSLLALGGIWVLASSAEDRASDVQKDGVGKSDEPKEPQEDEPTEGTE